MSKSNNQNKGLPQLAKGRVKCREYLMYVLDVRVEEERLTESGQTIKEKTIEELRTEFEKEHSSIYINL